MEKSFLHVEGADDRHTLVHLLIKNGIDYDSKPWPAQFPKFEEIGSDSEVLEGMTTAIRAATNRSIGFVIDANSDIKNRWEEIRKELSLAQVDDLPTMVPVEGFIGQSASYKAGVGVWVMPDNEHDGNLENFLSTLIADDDFLIKHAKESTDKALKLGAEFGTNSRSKAVVRTWLAWQKDPGHPYGRAIQRRYFSHDSEVAMRFVEWFKKLYSI